MTTAIDTSIIGATIVDIRPMTKEEKVLTFKKELSFIKNPELKKFTEIVLENVPDYFFTIPASSTGKYHPAYTCCNGGLVKHTQAAVRIAKELFNMHDKDCEFSDDDKDIIISSLILHDTVKNGFNAANKYTDAKHPLYATELIEKVVNEDDQFTEVRESFHSSNTKQIMFSAINSHMGRWNTDYRTKAEVLPKPNEVHI